MGVKASGGLDYFTISDGTNMYLYYGIDKSDAYLAKTTVSKFPSGWGSASAAANPCFEAIHVYKSKSDSKYYLMCETVSRYFNLFSSSSPGGSWKLVQSKWASSDKLVFNSGVSKWTNQVSHGEFIRSGYDEKLEITDINDVQILIQGIPSGTSGDYSKLPYKLGIIYNGATTVTSTMDGVGEDDTSAGVQSSSVSSSSAMMIVVSGLAVLVAGVAAVLFVRRRHLRAKAALQAQSACTATLPATAVVGYPRRASGQSGRQL
jgi:hypothetical protein